MQPSRPRWPLALCALVCGITSVARGAPALTLKGTRAAQEAPTPGHRRQATYQPARRQSPFEVVIRPERARKVVVEQVLTVDEVRRMPGAQSDPVRAVQSLPGVARPGVASGSLIVWGSAPVDTRVYVDGVPIPRVYHFGALRSVVNAEFISALTFQPGAYGADFGRGLGGLVNLETRAPRGDRLHGSVTLDLIDGSLTLEGPLRKDLHVAAGVRVSWIGAVLPLFTGGNPRLSPFYHDYQLALRYRPTPRDDLDLLIFGSGDRITTVVDDTDPLNDVDLVSNIYFTRARLRWTHRFHKDLTLTLTPSGGVDTFRLDTGSAGFYGAALTTTTRTLTGNLRAELSGRTTLGDRESRSGSAVVDPSELRATLAEGAVGLDLEMTRSGADLLLPVATAGSGNDPLATPGGNDAVRDSAGPIGGVLGDSLNADAYAPTVRRRLDVTLLQAAPYLVARVTALAGRLLLSPQLRGALYAVRSDAQSPLRSDLALEPRLFLRGEVLRGRLWVKAALGVFHQLPQADEISAATGNPRLSPQQAITYVGGVDATLGAALTVQAQGFYKDLRDLVVPLPAAPLGAVYPSQALNGRYSNDGSGRAFGGEVLLRLRAFRGLAGFLAYTLSRSERRDGPALPLHPYQYDQTHILTLVATYKLPWDLQVGLRFRYITGNPVTAVVGGVRYLPSNDYLALTGARYGARLPDFHQLDLRIDKTWTLNRFRLGVFLDIQNLYNRRNTESILYGGWQLSQSRGVVGLPIFPDLGVRADF